MIYSYHLGNNAYILDQDQLNGRDPDQGESDRLILINTVCKEKRCYAHVGLVLFANNLCKQVGLRSASVILGLIWVQTVWTLMVEATCSIMASDLVYTVLSSIYILSWTLCLLF